ncbi:MAG: GIY-YIG nuclease family protein [Candidatus Dojkabacteria bacterium]|nr:MAG: GIY-YIG nuclease family protein [Candidatus Dojkabacteria bacterium]
MSDRNEIIYILTNEAMPGYIKIGFTHGILEDRLRQLDTTSMPLPFEIYYACEVENAKKDEQWMHEIFGDKRVRDRREFFKMDPERAVVALQRIQVREIGIYASIATPAQQKEIAQKKRNRSRFDFKKYGIAVGTEIYFSRDGNIKAKVLGKNKIELKGIETSLSKSAEQLLGFGPVAGTLYWMYEDETLDERRRRMDSENNEKYE